MHGSSLHSGLVFLSASLESNSSLSSHRSFKSAEVEARTTRSYSRSMPTANLPPLSTMGSDRLKPSPLATLKWSPTSLLVSASESSNISASASSSFRLHRNRGLCACVFVCISVAVFFCVCHGVCVRGPREVIQGRTLTASHLDHEAERQHDARSKSVQIAASKPATTSAARMPHKRVSPRSHVKVCDGRRVSNTTAHAHADARNARERVCNKIVRRATRGCS